MDYKNIVTQLTKAFKTANYELFLVGGAIRDELVGKTPHELDFATDANPGMTKQILQSTNPTSLYNIGEKFGTIGAFFDEMKIEITTYRHEQYTAKSRHPEVIFGKDLTKDLSRRDFTINAIAYDEENKKYLDPFDGRKDIENRLICVVGDSAERFREDPLRILRAVRFAVVLDFNISPSTLKYIKETAHELGSISVERIAQEMDKILTSTKPSAGIQLLTDLNLLPYILPEFIPLQTIQHEHDEHKNIYEHTLQVLDNTPATKRLRWLALLHDIAKPETKSKTNGEVHFFEHEVRGSYTARNILKRLHYDTEFTNSVSSLTKFHLRVNLYETNWTDGAIKRLVLEVGNLLDDLIQFSYADITSKRPEKVARAHKKIDQFKERLATIHAKEELDKIKSPLTGDELIKLFDRPAGPWIKSIKQHLLDLVIDGELKQGDKKKAELVARDFLTDN